MSTSKLIWIVSGTRAPLQSSGGEHHCRRHLRQHRPADSCAIRRFSWIWITRFSTPTCLTEAAFVAVNCGAIPETLLESEPSHISCDPREWRTTMEHEENPLDSVNMESALPSRWLIAALLFLLTLGAGLAARLEAEPSRSTDPALPGQHDTLLRHAPAQAALRFEGRLDRSAVQVGRGYSARRSELTGTEANICLATT